MISADLLALLRCPASHQPLSLADSAVLAALNARISHPSPDAEQLLNHGGERVGEPLAEGLVRLDRALLYPVRDGLPILLVDEAIVL